MAEVHLPATLPPLFRDLPRRVEVDAATVGEAITRLDARWPGVRDRLCVDQERAGLETALGSHSRVDVIAAISGG
jgi:molybdopterin synthase sulfur carrier subunit